MKGLLGRAVIVLLVITLLWPTAASAQSVVSANVANGQPMTAVQQDMPPVQDDLSTAPGVRIVESTGHGVVLDVITPDFDVQEQRTENGACTRLTVPGYGESDKAGWPRVPVIGTMIGIPQDAEPALAVVETDVITRTVDHDLCPVPQPRYDVAPDGTVTYRGEAAVPDALAYATDRVYPAKIAEVMETGLIRNQRVVQLRFYPFRVNPVTGVLEYYRRIRVQVQFGGRAGDVTDDVEKRARVTGADPFDQLLEQVVANYDVARQWQEPSASRSAASSNQIHTPATSSSSYKLTVDADGIYRVTYADLEAAGVPVTTLDPRTFVLRAQGTEVAIDVVGEDDGVFDPGDAIIFYGQRMNTRYTDVNVYWLTWGGVNGLRMTGVDGAPTGSGTVPESFRTTQRVEQNVYYQSSRPSGADQDHWYWDYIWATAPSTAVFTTTLLAPAATPATATVWGLFKGYNAVPYHHTQVYLNGHLIDDATWLPQDEYVFKVDVPQSYLVEGVNTFTVHAPLDGGITGDYFFINRFEIAYQRTYAATGDGLTFDSDVPGTWEYAITGFTTATAQAFDVTTPTAPHRILNTISAPDGDTHTVRFEQTITGTHRYLVVTPAQFRSVLSIAADRSSDLHAPTNAADYIVITHRDFYTDVLPLADYRASQGLRTVVVDVQDIYDEFNDGIFDPNAIHDFLAYAYANWTAPAPSYVVLVGDGHYDFKDYLGYGEPNYIPPFLADVDFWLKETAADNRYVCVSGDDNLPDMHLGRLPVRTRAEAQAVVAKIIAYEQHPAPGDWNRQTLFVTDNPDSAGNFYAYSDAVADTYVPVPYAVQKVYYGQTHPTVSQARAAILDAINAGQLIINYVGHGSIFAWAAEHLLSRDDAGALTNAGRLPFVVPMACLDGYYIFPSPPGSDYSASSEVFVRAAGKGSIAHWSATGLGLAAAHDYLDKGLFEAIFSDDVTQLGPATLQSKLYLYTHTGGFQDQIDTYLLFGDPALRLNVVKADVSVTQTLHSTGVLWSGGDVTYRFSFSNTGPATAHHVVISDTLPAALNDPVVISTGATVTLRTGSALVWDVGDLPAGQGGVITVAATIDPAFSGALVNIVRITTSARESDLTNNSPDPAATTMYVYPDAPTSVGLASFTAAPAGDGVRLAWETASELDLLGFNLYRAVEEDGEPAAINAALIPSQAPGSTQGASYTYLDATAKPGVTYFYWVQTVTLHGTTAQSDPVSAKLSAPSMTTSVFLPLVVNTH